MHKRALNTDIQSVGVVLDYHLSALIIMRLLN